MHVFLNKKRFTGIIHLGAGHVLTDGAVARAYDTPYWIRKEGEVFHLMEFLLVTETKNGTQGHRH